MKRNIEIKYYNLWTTDNEVEVKGKIDDNGNIHIEELPDEIISEVIINEDSNRPDEIDIEFIDEDLGLNLKTEYRNNLLFGSISEDALTGLYFKKVNRKDIINAIMKYDFDSFIRLLASSLTPHTYNPTDEESKITNNLELDIEEKLKENPKYVKKVIETGANEVYNKIIKPAKQKCRTIKEPYEYYMCIDKTMDELLKKTRLGIKENIKNQVWFFSREEEFPEKMKKQLCDVYQQHMIDFYTLPENSDIRKSFFRKMEIMCGDKNGQNSW